MGCLTNVDQIVSDSAEQRQAAVTVFFELQDSLLPSSTGILTVGQRQTAVTAYFKSEQLLMFNFAVDIFRKKANSSNCLIAYLKSEQSLLFAFVWRFCLRRK